MKIKLLPILALMFIALACNESYEKVSILSDGEKIVISNDDLLDRIKGGWAGQVIGCTYGGPTEFKFKGSMIPDDHFIPWYDGIIEWWYENAPGLYDDVYMDLTFVDVFQKYGLDAPIDSFANAFAYADYMLWHANQAARYNIMNGIMPPESGHWLNNPHADDIDFQIEADFAGIMAPGLVNAATDISDGIGHIMNYGDGWYGGVYVAAMYSLAYISDDVEFIVEEGLKSIPSESDFYKLQADVIRWYREYPEDWKDTWFQLQKKWASEKGCPDGVYSDFNIDAKLNAAFIIIGLLYGKGDFGESIRISTLCGQDSDCNPASAAGILGVMKGYSNIPEEWKLGLDDVEDMDFKYTDISLNDAYKYSYDQAKKVVEKYGGTVDNNTISITYQKPVSVRFEEAFTGHYPVEYRDAGHLFTTEQNTLEFAFEGNGFVVSGGCEWGADPSYAGLVDVYVDGELFEMSELPASYQARRHEITWAYNLEQGEHTVKLVLNNPDPDARIRAGKIIVYSSEQEHRVRQGISFL